MKQKKECDRACINLIQSKHDKDKNKGLKQLISCFKNKAHTSLYKKGVKNYSDQDDIFSDFLKKISQSNYPEKNCEERLFFYSLEQCRINYYKANKSYGNAIEKYNNSITDDVNVTNRDTTHDIDAEDCINKVWSHMKEKHPKDYNFLIAYKNRKNSLKDLAKTLLISYGAVRERKSKIFKRFNEIKYGLCGND